MPSRCATALSRHSVLLRLIRHNAIALLALALLGACSPQAQDALARDAAKSVVARTAAERLPGVPVEPYTDCIIDNASAQQILALAADSVTGPTESSWEIVSQIASKPETLQCLVATGLPALLR